MIRDDDLSHGQATELRVADLQALFESAATDIRTGKSTQRELLSVSRDEYNNFHGYSSFAPIGSCAQTDLDSALCTFLQNLTGKNQKALLHMTITEPDSRHQEYHYNTLVSCYETLQDSTQLKVTVLVDKRGILSATWTLQASRH